MYSARHSCPNRWQIVEEDGSDAPNGAVYEKWPDDAAHVWAMKNWGANMDYVLSFEVRLRLYDEPAAKVLVYDVTVRPVPTFDVRKRL
jgi:hypothetical protein